MTQAIRNALTDNSTRDNTGDSIDGADVDANPYAIADIMDGTTSTALGQNGAVAVSGDLSVGDDLTLGSDSAVLNFGASSEISVTHVADTGLTVGGAHANGTNFQLNNTASDGDAAIQFALSGTVKYTLGVEDGDSDKFVINYGTGALGAAPALEIDTSGNTTVAGTLGSGAITGTSTLAIGGNFTAYEDANNADVTLSFGTSATEALFIEALNGGSNKTLEELRFTTKTASATGDHGKVSFYVDEAEIATIDDGGIDLASGKSFTVAGSALAGAVTAINSATANELVTIGSTTTELDAEENLTYDDTNGLKVTSATASKPILTIENTNNGATSGYLKFVNDRGAAGAADDVSGTITFYSDDANQDNIEFARVEGMVAVHTEGQEGGKLKLSVASHDGEINQGILIADGSVEDEVDVTLGNGTASLTTIAGVMTKPAQPAFSAYNAGHLSNVTGDGTVYGAENADGSGDLIGFALTSTRFNIGSGYSTSSPYVFTAPVDGRYLLSGCVQTAGVLAAHNEFIIYLKTSNYQFYVKIKGEVISGENYGYGQSTDPFSFIADMEAGDIAGLKIDVRGSTKVVDVNAHTFFSGCLLT